MNFWRVIEILSKRKWLIVLSVVVAAALSAGATHLIGSRWVATVQLVVPQNAAILRSSNYQDQTQDQDTNANSTPANAKDQIAAYMAVAKSRIPSGKGRSLWQTEQLEPLRRAHA